MVYTTEAAWNEKTLTPKTGAEFDALASELVSLRERGEFKAIRFMLEQLAKFADENFSGCRRYEKFSDGGHCVFEEWRILRNSMAECKFVSKERATAST